MKALILNSCWRQLDRFVTDGVLREHFRGCGRVSEISIRCSRGVAAKYDLRGVSKTIQLQDRVYATVEFSNGSSAVPKALKLNGTRLRDRRYKIIVCLNAYELPEGQRLRKRKKEILPSEQMSFPFTLS